MNRICVEKRVLSGASDTDSDHDLDFTSNPDSVVFVGATGSAVPVQDDKCHMCGLCDLPSPAANSLHFRISRRRILA